MGRRIIHPLDAQCKRNRESADLLDYLARESQRNDYDVKKTLELDRDFPDLSGPD